MYENLDELITGSEYSQFEISYPFNLTGTTEQIRRVNKALKKVLPFGTLVNTGTRAGRMVTKVFHHAPIYCETQDKIMKEVNRGLGKTGNSDILFTFSTHYRKDFRHTLEYVLRPDLPVDDRAKGDFEKIVQGVQLFVPIGIPKQIRIEEPPYTDLPPSEDDAPEDSDENTTVTRGVHRCPQCGSRATHTTGWLPMTESSEPIDKSKWKRIIYP
jgi:hypothetical protein